MGGVFSMSASPFSFSVAHWKKFALPVVLLFGTAKEYFSFVWSFFFHRPTFACFVVIARGFWKYNFVGPFEVFASVCVF